VEPLLTPLVCWCAEARFVNGAGAVCDQKTSKFFVSHHKESMAGHVGVTGVYLKLGKHGGAQVEARS
jgi:hypothetical protein